MKNFFNSLFWEIASVFLLILLIVSAIQYYIFINNAEMFFQETHQYLDSNIAAHIASENDCFIGDSVNFSALQNVFHNVMIINPSIELYLLGIDGKVLAYDAPREEIIIDYVPLEPIHKFISDGEGKYITGTDPKNPGKQKTFSAAEVVENDKLQGYIYIILTSQEYDTISKMVLSSYILKLSFRSMAITFVTALVIGLISIGIIIGNIKKIIKVLRAFKSGNLNARIHLRSKTELSEFAESFNEMADTILSNIYELKKTDQLRRDLAANVSHDLRTPLSIIRGYAETIKMKNESLSRKDHQYYTDLILESVDRLILLVNELFELSKLEANKVKIEKEFFPLAELVQNIYHQNLIIAEKKKITLTLDCAGGPFRVEADISMMGKVIQNLLDNAFRHTPSGGNVNISLKKNNNDEYEVWIADTGFGIEKEQIDHIFNRYYKDPSQQTPGAGIGLSIVKKIIELHQFKISVQSKPTEGSIFKIIIPQKH